MYWATGITPVYLEGALERALKRPVQHEGTASEPVFDEPAPSIIHEVRAPVSDAILDPLEVYEQHGEEMLRQKLTALGAIHLVRIALAYNLTDEPLATLETLSADALIDMIVSAVRLRFSRE